MIPVGWSGWMTLMIQKLIRFSIFSELFKRGILVFKIMGISLVTKNPEVRH